MAEELDTRWFDLTNYEPFRTMSIEAWIYQLEMRAYFHMLEREKPMPLRELEECYSSIVADLKMGVIPDDRDNPNWIHEMRVGAILEGRPFDTASVKSLTSYDLWEIVNDDGLDHIWDACQHHLEDEWDERASDIAFSPHDLNDKVRFEYFRIAHVAINLSASDEQIKNDFGHWLENFRKTIDHPHLKKLITQADFDRWIEYGVIPYLDLVLIAKIFRKKITQNKLARLIFPDEYDVDIVDRLRKVTKPTAEWLIKNNIDKSLSTQLVFEKSGMKSP